MFTKKNRRKYCLGMMVFKLIYYYKYQTLKNKPHQINKIK